MFTGIVTDLGVVRSVRDAGDRRIEFGCSYPPETIPVGTSIACSGVCLTAIDRGPGWFAVTASRETLDRTTLGGWREGTPVNFERALRLGDELGGHLVSGHVDGVATLSALRPDGDSWRMTFEVPAELARYIAGKGSVALDGVSLTVNEVEGRCFGVNIIPHTWAVTTLGRLAVGNPVNIEVDLIARYVARLRDAGS